MTTGNTCVGWSHISQKVGQLLPCDNMIRVGVLAVSTELIGKDVGNIEAASIQLERYYILMATGLRELDLSYGEASALVDCLNLGNYMESVVGS